MVRARGRPFAGLDLRPTWSTMTIVRQTAPRDRRNTTQTPTRGFWWRGTLGAAFGGLIDDSSYSRRDHHHHVMLRRGVGLGGRLRALIVLGVAFALVGCGSSLPSTSSNPGPTPRTTSPAPSSTAQSSISPSGPAPSASVAPSSTPAPEINKVRVEGGQGETDAPAPNYPYYELSFRAITVVYERVNISKGTILIGLTSAGRKVKVSYSSLIDRQYIEKITGETVYVQFDRNSELSDENIGTIGQGAEAMLPYIKVGSVLRWVNIDLDRVPNGSPSWPDTSTQRSHNRTVLQRLLDSNGKTISRTDQGLLFYGGSLVVVKGNDIVNP